ncbi:MAG TPA: Spy/CpxP family protein refolding chaperone [Bryobacteraceae bacterium]|nr:Spy/CpxP family protein refolding chaperone [Bryobacteraceae bacterium]
MTRFAVLLALAALPVLAQAPRAMFQWWNSPIARDLNLSSDQQQQIRSTLREYRNRVIDLRAAVDKAEGELEDAFNEERVDERRAADAIDRLANSRAEMTRVISQMSLRLRAVLTPEQWRELQKRRQQGAPGPGMYRRPGRGPGARPPEDNPSRGGGL